MVPTPDAGPGLGILHLSSAALLSYRRALGLRSDRSALIALARAIAASPGWPAGTAFVVRPDPAPVLGIFAEDLDPVRLRLQVHAAESGVGRLRYIGYDEAEAAAEKLATRLVESYGAEAVRRFRYTPLPRGGLIVLGLLASRLDLPADRLSNAPPDAGEDTPLVVVDDCALSGGRFGAFLHDCPARQVIFAQLYSPPALRAAIEAGEPRVLACLAAHNLEDGDEVRERWGRRLSGPRYGPGTGDRIAFPWNEPDRLLWNQDTGEVELGWKLVPPELCLKQRAAADSSARPRIQVQPRGLGPWRPSSTVLFAEHRAETVVHRLDTGEVFRLPGTAHAMWRALLRAGDPAAASRLLLARYRVAAATLEADLAQFLQTLRERGLVEPAKSS